MEPRSFGGADRLLQHVDEGGHVVVNDPLAVVDSGDEARRHLRCAGPHGVGHGAGDGAYLRPPLHGQQLDLEPHLEARLVGEQRRHLRQRVAGDHRGSPVTDVAAAIGAASVAPERAAAAMSVRYVIPSQPMRSTAA